MNRLSWERATLLGMVVIQPGLTLRQLREHLPAWERGVVQGELQALINQGSVIAAPCAVSGCCGDAADEGRHAYATRYYEEQKGEN